jgi:hypothetical protein
MGALGSVQIIMPEGPDVFWTWSLHMKSGSTGKIFFMQILDIFSDYL